MKKKEWMQSENPVNLQCNQIELDELKKLTNYDENDKNIKQSLQQIKKFYSLLYQHKPTDNISKLLKKNLIHNRYEYYDTCYNKKEEWLYKICFIQIFGAGLASMVGIFLENVQITAWGAVLIFGVLVTVAYMFGFAGIRYENVLMYYSDKVSNDEDYVESIARLMVKAIKKDSPSVINTLGVLSSMGIDYIERCNGNELPTPEEIRRLVELDRKIENGEEIEYQKVQEVKSESSNINQFLVDVKSDINKVNAIKYDGYEEDLKELYDIAKSFIEETAPKVNGTKVSLEKSKIPELYKKLVTLEQNIDVKINRKNYIDENMSFITEDLATQLSVDKLDKARELKLTLKK